VPTSPHTIVMTMSRLGEPLVIVSAIVPPMPEIAPTRNVQKAILPRVESGWRANRCARFASMLIAGYFPFFARIHCDMLDTLAPDKLAYFCFASE
jgi:hypothetical protein